MSWRKTISFIGLIVLLLSALPMSAGATPVKQAALNKIEPLVLEEISQAGQTDFFVNLAEQADVSYADQILSWQEKGRYVYETLRATADRTQADLRAYLDKIGARYETYYIVNAILVRGGNQALALELAARPEVASLTANHKFQLQEPFKSPDQGQIDVVEPNISFVNADDVWALGYTGQGTVMAGNDTGLYWSHPALIRQYRGCQDPPTCSNIDHNYNWWDATGTYPNAPDDGHGHGTHTTGTMVGEDASQQNQIGMAPGARTVHCKNMDNGGSGQDAWFLTCFEWDLAPWDLNHNNPNPDMRPDAINNSWGYWGGGNNVFRTAIDNLQAAGTVVEVSAGNEGPGCQTLRSPGDYQEVITTGSVNHAGGALPGTITGFSSRGPSTLDGNYFPDVMAPGENIRSSVPGGGYQGGWSGTSMAGPHVTGLIGLMWSACPTFRGMVDETYQIIKDTAVPLTGQGGSGCGGDYTIGPNNDWGYGTIDALAAVNEIIAQCGPTGALEGYVTDAVSGGPIQGAIVRVQSWSKTTDGTGYYYFPMLPEGTYDVTAEHPHYETGLNSGVEIISGTTTVSDFQLTPRGRLFGYVTDYDNGFPLVGATVTADDGTWTTTGPGGYYEMYLDEGTQDVTASMPDYAPDTQTVTIVSGQDTQQDFELIAAVAFIPSPLHVTVPWQQTYNMLAELNNRMPTPYDYVFGEEPGGFVPGLLGTAQVTIPAGPATVPAGTAAATDLYKPLPETTYTQPRYAQPEAPPNVLLVMADDGNGEPIRTQLLAFGDLGAVDVFDARYGTPTLAQLQAYDVVLAWSNYNYADPTGMGNVLADYVDGGGRVITLMFSMGTHGWQMGGRFMTENYTAVNGTGILYANSCLGTYDPTHPIMADPTPITNVCDLYRLAGTYLTPGATAVAYWQDGTIFVGAKDDRSTVGITGYVGTYRQWTGQMDALVHNAILWMVVPPEVPWFDQTPAAGTVPAGSSVYPTMLFTATTAVGVNQPGDYWCTLNVNGDPDLEVRVTMTVEPDPTMGRVRGYVVDHCTGAPVEEVLVAFTGGDPITQTQTDADGYYSAWLYTGTYPVAFTAPDYLPYNTTIDVVAGQTTTLDVDFFPNRPCMVVEPDTMSATLSWGDSATYPLTITNDGAVDLEFEFQELDRGWVPLVRTVSIPPSDGNFPHGDEPTSIGPAPNAPQYVAGGPGLPGILAGAPAYAVDIYPGYNLVYFESETPNPWTVIAPLPGNQYFAGDFVGGDFSTLYVIDYGTLSLYAVDTTTGAATLIGPSTPYGGESWTGMTGAPDGTMYASSTNISRSTLYTVDLDTGAVTVVGEITNCPAIIDIAYNTQDGFIYGVEIVNDVLIRVDPATGEGTVVGSLGVGANYAQGMDFEEESGVLYWAAYTSQGELRIIDPTTGNSVLVGAFPGGAETDSLAFATGGAAGDVPWLFEDPVSDTVAPGGSFVVDVTMDSNYVYQPGTYWATLKVKSNDPENSAFPVYVTMTVLPSSDMGRVGGYVTDNCTGEPVDKALVHFVDGVPVSMTQTGPDGFYAGWLVSGTYDVEFSADGYLPYATSVTVVAGEMATLDVILIPDRPCIAVDPAGFEVWLLEGTAVYTHPTGLDITNNGGQDLDFTILEISGVSGLRNSVPAPVDANTAAAPAGYRPQLTRSQSQGQGINVCGTVAVLKDADAWGVTDVENFLAANGIAYEVHGSAEFGSLDFNQFGMIVFSGDQPTSFYDAYGNYIAKFEDYVNAGGFLNFYACDAGWNGGTLSDPLPGGMVWTGWAYDNYNVIDDPAHPVVQGVPNPFYGNYASHGHFSSLPAEAHVIAHEQTGGQPTIVEYPMGAGWLIAFGQPLEISHNWGWDAGLIMENSLLWGCTYVPAGDIWWVWEDPVSGTVPSLSGGHVDIMFSALYTDTTPMPLGDYYATLLVNSNDPVATDPRLPTIMHIVAELIPPTASFEHTAPVCDGEEVIFTDTSNPGVPDVIEWFWDFGDGHTSTEQHPTHLYDGPGTYTVTLTITQWQTGLTDTYSDIVEVNPLPEAGFTYAVDELTVTFTDASNEATSWLWDFGDGITDTVQNPVHTYAAAGTYTVTQWAFNDCGSAMFQDLVTVGLAPDADFTYNTPVCLGTPVTFTNGTAGTPPIFYEWDFGDGITDTVESPVHVYATVGTFDVTLHAWNDFGDDQATGQVEVLPLPEAAFTYTVNGLEVTFSDLSVGATSWLWDFGDGVGTSTEQNPTYVYATAGTYDVALEVTGVCGTDTATVQVTVALARYYLYLPLIYKTAIP